VHCHDDHDTVADVSAETSRLSLTAALGSSPPGLTPSAMGWFGLYGARSNRTERPVGLEIGHQLELLGRRTVGRLVFHS
jgi:hypothetical protein